MKGTTITAVAAALTLALGSIAFAGERTVNLKVGGMSCGMCSAAIEKALEGVEGVQSAEATMEDGGIAKIVVDETAEESALIDAVKSAGFTAQVATSN